MDEEDVSESSAMHDHGPKLSDDVSSPAEEECPFTLINLACGCQDVAYACGFLDREHDHVVCDGQPKPNPNANLRSSTDQGK